MTVPNRDHRNPSPSRRRRLARRGAGLALVLSFGPNLGCGREFYRQWADQDVTEAVFEKSRDPRWRMDMFTIEPPALARFADPYDPDRPPAPPDDHAAEAVSPTPQWPHFRLMTPMEGTGYLDLMETWKAENQAAIDRARAEARKGTGLTQPHPAPRGPAEAAPAPLPGPGERSPFRPGEAAPNSGTNPAETSPIQDRVTPPAQPTTPDLDPGAGPNPPQTNTPSKPKSPRQEPGVQLAAFQATETPAPAGPSQPEVPSGPPNPPRVDIDPGRNQPQPTEPVLPPVGGPEEAAASAGLAAILNPGVLDFDEAAAAGLPSNSRPYIINPAQALTLSLVNSRTYQFQIEQVYLASLTVTLNRFAFEPQFYAGITPQTLPGSVGLGSFVPPSGAGLAPIAGVIGGPGVGVAAGVSPATSWLYSTRESLRGQSSTLSLGTVAGFGKLFMLGGRLAAGFANQTVFNLVGVNPRQPIQVNSFLPLSFVQPFLRGGGRAVTLEPLTSSERNLLYTVRSFTRFRQQWVPYVLGSGTPGVPGAPVTTNLDSNPGVTEPVVGYLQIVEQAQVVENDRRAVAAFEQVYKVITELAKGPASGLSQLQVDQINQQLFTFRQTLVQDEATYRNLLDSFKLQLGMPTDTPLILDRRVMQGFRDVFNDLERWAAREDREPQELKVIIGRLPALPDVDIDNWSVLRDRDPATLESLNLAAERVALENRVDLMNFRANLYDIWRQLAVTANALRGVFNVQITNQITTPPTTTNPFAFIDQAKQFSLVLNAELPLIRVNERNNFRVSLMNYRRAQRLLQSQEDNIKLAIRNEIRGLYQLAQTYEINRITLELNVRQKDNILRQILAPPTAADVSNPGGASAQQAIQIPNLITAQSNILRTQNQLIAFWVNYQTQRMALYRDLGIMPYDEWEAFYELFPANSANDGAAGPVTDARPARPGAPAVASSRAGRGS